MSTTPSPILLRLDARALAALFPEGSQARVDLQQAVVAEFLRKNVKPSVVAGDMHAQINTAINEAVAKAQHELGIQRDTWGRIKLTGEAQKAVAQAAENAVGDHASKVAKEHAAEVSASIRERIERITDEEIRAAIKTRVAELVGRIGAQG